MDPEFVKWVILVGVVVGCIGLALLLIIRESIIQAHFEIERRERERRGGRWSP